MYTPPCVLFFFFFFNDTATTEIYTLSLHDALPISIPLIAASIMSKKLAEGLNALVLDVKRGTGAFLPKVEQSLELAQTMIALGEDRGCPSGNEIGRASCRERV